MSKQPRKNTRKGAGDLRSEYTVDYANSRANRFDRLRGDAVAVILEPDVAQVIYFR